MEPGVSFAHKIAAWNERELMRDLYDIYQYESLFKVKPQIDILQMRLKKARSYKGVTAAREINELVDKLTQVAEKLNDDNLAELRPLLSEEELAGLAFRMRPAILRLCEKLRF